MAKKNVSLILILFLLLTFVSLIQAEEIEIQVIVEQANLRLKPGLTSLILAKIPRGAVLKAFEKTGEWYHINLPPDNRGFVVSGYIHRSVVEEIGKTPESIPAPEKDVVETPERFVPPLPPPLPERRRPTPYTQSTGKKIGIGLRAGYGGSGLMFGGSLNFLLMKNLGISIEGLSFSSTEEGSTESANGTFLSKGKATVIPIQFSLQARFPLSPQITPYITAGGGYYLSSFALDSTILSDWDTLGFTIEETIKAAFGFHGGAGFDFFLSDSIALNLDARYIVLKPKGTWNITDQISSATTSGDIDTIDLSSIMLGLGFKFFF